MVLENPMPIGMATGHVDLEFAMSWGKLSTIKLSTGAGAQHIKAQCKGKFPFLSGMQTPSSHCSINNKIISMFDYDDSMLSVSTNQHWLDCFLALLQAT